MDELPDKASFKGKFLVIYGHFNIDKGFVSASFTGESSLKIEFISGTG
jgi:hypothetical protein